MKLQVFFTALAVLCFLYGLLVLSVGSGNGFWLVWVTGAVCFLLLAAAVHFHVWSYLPLAAKAAFILFVTACAAIFIVTEAKVASGFRGDERPGLDYVIILGAQVYEDGPSFALKYRLDKALEYLNENEDTLCIVSGGQGYNEPFPEADGMKDYLVSHGIREDRILTEPKSINTKQNIDFSMKLLDPEHDSVGLITSDFHLYRASRIAEKAGIRNLFPIPAYSNRLYLPNNMLREFFGMMKDLTAGNI